MPRLEKIPFFFAGFLHPVGISFSRGGRWVNVLVFVGYLGGSGGPGVLHLFRFEWISGYGHIILVGGL